VRSRLHRAVCIAAGRVGRRGYDAHCMTRRRRLSRPHARHQYDADTSGGRRRGVERGWRGVAAGVSGAGGCVSRDDRRRLGAVCVRHRLRLYCSVLRALHRRCRSSHCVADRGAG
jgi:hypothetical protein